MISRLKYNQYDKCILLNPSVCTHFNHAIFCATHVGFSVTVIASLSQVFGLTFPLYLHTFSSRELFSLPFPSPHPCQSTAVFYLCSRCRRRADLSHVEDEEPHIPVSYVDGGRTAQPPTTLHIGYPRSLAPSSTNIPQPVAASTTGNSRRFGISLSLDRRHRVRASPDIPPTV